MVKLSRSVDQRCDFSATSHRGISCAIAFMLRGDTCLLYPWKYLFNAYLGDSEINCNSMFSFQTSCTFHKVHNNSWVVEEDVPLEQRKSSRGWEVSLSHRLMVSSVGLVWRRDVLENRRQRVCRSKQKVSFSH